MKYEESQWITLNSKRRQCVRRIEERVYQFKQRVNSKKLIRKLGKSEFKFDINLTEYSHQEMEEALNKAGYTFNPNNTALKYIDTFPSIQEKEIFIAKCLFEEESFE